MKVHATIDFVEASKILHKALEKKLNKEVTGVTITSYDNPRIDIQFCAHGMFDAIAFRHRMHDWNE